MYNLWGKIKYGISEVVQSRTSVAIIVFCVMSAILVQRLFYLQIVRGEDYAEDYELQIQKTKERKEPAEIFMTATETFLPIMNWPTL